MATTTQRPRPRARKASVDVASLTSATAGCSGSVVKTSVSPNPGADAVNGNGDDGDDFFVRRRKLASGVKTISAPVGGIDAGDFMRNPAGITVEEEEGEEEESNDDSDGAQSNGGFSSDEGRRRKRSRRQKPSWTKSASLSKAEAALKLSSSSLLGSKSHLLSRSTDTEDQLLEKKSTRERELRSPSLTPPPPISDDVLDRLRQVIDQHAHSQPIVDDEDSSFLDEHDKVANLDPDLVRMMKSARARELRRLAKEQEARQRETSERARRGGSSTVSTSDAPFSASQIQGMEVIQVDDSDEENRAGLSSKRGNRQAANAYSSSPVQIVSPPPPRRAIVASPPAQSTETASDRQVSVASPPKEEEERISITMKGGEGGMLHALVKVKPTTQGKKLLDHFVNTHKQSIPANKRKSVRLRFDGDWIVPTATIGSIGIEDEEQIDVVW